LTLSADKAYLIHHRLGPLVHRFGLRTYEDLCERLRAGGPIPIQDEVVQAITTHETSFFRDAHPFEALRRTLLPEVVRAARLRKKAGGIGPFLRIWCAGVATGQEPYSVAMLLREQVQQVPFGDLAPSDCVILATDISATDLVTARAGVYSDREVMRSVALPYRTTCFEKHGEDWRVVDSVRRLVTFRRANLLDGLTDSNPVDMILCRNVLIYFDEVTRRSVCRIFSNVLAEGGALLLGAAENLYGIGDQWLSEQHGATIFYRKRR
jgi:chemotaxis protein methyltransferase CheR